MTTRPLKKQVTPDRQTVTLSIDAIVPDPCQPRKTFSDDSQKSLAPQPSDNRPSKSYCRQARPGREVCHRGR